MVNTIITISLVLFILFLLLPFCTLSFILYSILFIRYNKKKWARGIVEFPDDEKFVRMIDAGKKWFEKNKKYKIEVSINNGKYTLKGQYFNYKNSKVVIIIPGRTDSCTYSYYFAETYKKISYNVLVIDNRAHGLSDGYVCNFGYKEFEDVLKWSSLMCDKFKNKHIIYHGICIGSSTALFAIINKDCPKCVDGIIAEGMYTKFSESFKNHLVYDRHMVYPLLFFINIYIRLFSHADVVNNGPIYVIDKLRKPILFLHSKEDPFSTPEQAKNLYKKCNSLKKIVWFKKGEHSKIRIDNKEKFDFEIKQFVKQYL